MQARRNGRQWELLPTKKDLDVLERARCLLDTISGIRCDEQEAGAIGEKAIQDFFDFQELSNRTDGETDGMLEKPVSSNTPDEEELIGRHMTAEAATNEPVDSVVESTQPVMSEDEAALATAELESGLQNATQSGECKAIGNRYIDAGLSIDVVIRLVHARRTEIRARGPRSNKPKDSDEEAERTEDAAEDEAREFPLDPAYGGASED